MLKHVVRFLLACLAVVLVAAVFALQGCAQGDGNTSNQGSGADAAQTDPAPTDDSQEATAPPVPGEEPMYNATYEPTGEEVAVISTPRGVIKFEFYAADAPNHVAAFIELANKGFYNGTTFHRVEPGFVIQGGDPYSKTNEGPVGTGGPGYRLAAEFNSKQHLEGTVAMARSMDPDSAGSQFYICLAPQPGLDGQYTVFGQVIEGMDIVRATQVGDVMESVVIENAAE